MLLFHKKSGGSLELRIVSTATVSLSNPGVLLRNARRWSTTCTPAGKAEADGRLSNTNSVTLSGNCALSTSPARKAPVRAPFPGPEDCPARKLVSSSLSFSDGNVVMPQGERNPIDFSDSSTESDAYWDRRRTLRCATRAQSTASWFRTRFIVVSKRDPRRNLA
jgi:hypothetical protein